MADLLQRLSKCPDCNSAGQRLLIFDKETMLKTKLCLCNLTPNLCFVEFLPKKVIIEHESKYQKR